MRTKSLPAIEADAPADLDMLRIRLHRRRLGWGVVAAALSVALHIGLALRLPRLVFPQALEAVRERIFKPFQVDAVERQPRAVEPARPERATAAQPGPGFNVRSDALTVQRAVDDVKLAPQPLASGALDQPHAAPPVPAAEAIVRWEPREEILRIQERLIQEEIPDRPRRLIPDTPRIRGAAEVVLPVEEPRRLAAQTAPAALSEAARRSVDQARPPSVEAADTRWENLENLLKPAPGPVLRAGGATAGPAALPAATPAALPPVVGEPLQPVEQMLAASMHLYRDRSDPEYVYARIEIRRDGQERLPVLPKDILFIQDCSASITEARLAACREGLLRCLAQIGPRDRFNVVGFRDTVMRCFPDWAPATAENLEAARGFVRALESKGNTDIYASLRELLAMPAKPVRPVIVLLISDGLPTAGMRDSASIIAAFTRANAGAVSAFALATFDQANLYLLDMLSYMNRGDSAVARRGRWSIPEGLDTLATGVSRPVLSDMRFRFSETAAEVVPALTPNLYLDRALVLYGRFPRETERVVFQVVGRAASGGCDMVFDLRAADAAPGDASIREEWAWHKIYGLIGAHTLSRDAAQVDAIRRLARAYRLQVPYAEELD